MFFFKKNVPLYNIFVEDKIFPIFRDGGLKIKTFKNFHHIYIYFMNINSIHIYTCTCTLIMTINNNIKYEHEIVNIYMYIFLMFNFILHFLTHFVVLEYSEQFN